MNWTQLELANENNLEGQRLRTSFLNDDWCAWAPVDGVPLMLGAASRGWSRVVDVCLRHMFDIPDHAKLARPRDWPVQACCVTHATANQVVSPWDMRPVAEQLLHMCVWYSPPSLFSMWDEWDCVVKCLPPIGDPGWATVFILWHQNEVVSADTILAWSIALHRMRLERLASMGAKIQVDTWAHDLQRMWAHDPYRTCHFEGNETKLIDLIQIFQAGNKHDVGR